MNLFGGFYDIGVKRRDREQEGGKKRKERWERRKDDRSARRREEVVVSSEKGHVPDHRHLSHCKDISCKYIN